MTTRTFPAIARAGDSIWVSFIRFSHSAREMESFAPLPQPPVSFDYLTRPAGGDQVFAMRYSISSGKWDAPVAVSPRGEDVAGAAIAIDGQNRVWTIWSARRNGNSDLYARAATDGAWGPELRLTSNPGTDLNPVATTDSAGRVWIAWQGFRNNNLEVLAAVQNGDGFSPETGCRFRPPATGTPRSRPRRPAMSRSHGIPTIKATTTSGSAVCAFRRMATDPQPDPPVAAAATENFEAHTSVAFDARNRLWAAYEVSGPRWGKNFGAYETTGTPLYEDRDIRVKCFDGDAAFVTSGDLINVMPGPPAALRRARQVRPNRNLLAPNPNLARNRRPQPGGRPESAMRRSTACPGWPSTRPAPYISRSGRSTARSIRARRWARSGLSTWSTSTGTTGRVRCFCREPMDCSSNRPGAAGLRTRASARRLRHGPPAIHAPGTGRAGSADRINSDLYSADLRLDGVPAPAAKAGTDDDQTRAARCARSRASKREREQVALVRAYRIAAGGAATPHPARRHQPAYRIFGGWRARRLARATHIAT